MDVRAHWEAVHREKRPEEVSWFHPQAERALRFISRLEIKPGAHVLDVGCGVTGLAAALGRADLEVTALDVSAAALERARERLGPDAARVRWVEADVREYVPHRPVDLWHDRAVFHFLVSAHDRDRYRDALLAAVPVGGHALIATFAPDGPERCSGLPVMRYDADALAAVFAPWFVRVEDTREAHVTPRGATQAFTWLLLRRVE